MNLGSLEGFYWVARERGYTRAARAFPYPISQPGVFQQVKKLEAQLGVALFERIKKDEVALTAAGERLYAFCAPFFEELPGVVDAIVSERPGGVLRMEASGLVLRGILPGWIRSLRQAEPEISVDVQELQTIDFERLRTGAAHLIVDYSEAVPDDVEQRAIATSYAFLVVPDAHCHLRRGELAQLASLPFVSYHPSLPHYALQLRALQQHVGTPKRTVSASSVDAILAFVSAGLGFSVVPWLHREGPKVPGVSAKRVTGVGTTFPILAMWRRGHHALVQSALDALE